MAASAPAPGGTPPAPRSASELLALHDVGFVQAAYRLLLGREADDSGLASFVGQVRQGDDKAQVLWRLAQSDEGRQHQTQLDGLDELLRNCAPRSRPFAVRLLQRLGRGMLRPANEPLERMLRVLDNRLYRIERALDQQAGELNQLRDAAAQIAISIEAVKSQQAAPSAGGPVAAGAAATTWPRQVPPRLEQVMQGLRRALNRRRPQP